MNTPGSNSSMILLFESSCHLFTLFTSSGVTIVGDFDVVLALGMFL